MRFRILFISVFALFGVYTIYWFVLANRLEHKITDWIEAKRHEGVEVTYESLKVHGFPYRLEVEWLKPTFSVRGGAVPFRWQSPLLMMEMLPWKPTHVLVLTKESSLEIEHTPFGTLGIKVSGGRASMVASVSGQPKRADAVAEKICWSGSLHPGQSSTADHSEIHFRVPDDAEKAVTATNPSGPTLSKFAFSTTDIRLANVPQNPYGNTISFVQSQIEVRGTTPPGREAVQMAAWRDAGGTLEVPQFLAKWGSFDTKVSGTLSLDEEMRPLGAFIVKVKGYEALIDYLRATSRIDGEMATNAKETFGMIVQSGSEEDEGRIAVPITFQGGRLFFGPVLVARLPSLTPFLIPAAASASAASSPAKPAMSAPPVKAVQPETISKARQLPASRPQPAFKSPAAPAFTFNPIKVAGC